MSWTLAALEELAAICNESDNKRAVTTASLLIDKQLEAAPLNCRESRAGTTRILIQIPLGVHYEVNAASGRVEVHAVWKINPPRK